MADKIDFDHLAKQAGRLLTECTAGNPRILDLFTTDLGYKLILRALEKCADLASKKIKNLKKAQEFAIWFGNEFESKVGKPAPDKIINLVREVCVNLLTPWKTTFFQGD